MLICRESNAPPPEIHVVDMKGVEIANDVLSMQGYQTFSPFSYRLASSWSPLLSDPEKTFFIVSPLDVVLAKPRDVSDHVAWLVEGAHYLSAIQLLQNDTRHFSAQEKERILLEVGQQYIQQLTNEKNWDLAAQWCQTIFQVGNSELWEKWIYLFAESKNARWLVDRVPETLLPKHLNELILNEFLNLNELESFYTWIQTWSASVYTVKNVIAAVLSLDRSEEELTRKILMYLYEEDGQLDQSVFFALGLGVPGQAERIETLNLWGFLHGHVYHLIDYAYNQSLSLATSRVERVRWTIGSKPINILVTVSVWD
jgi:hypothetical protein